MNRNTVLSVGLVCLGLLAACGPKAEFPATETYDMLIIGGDIIDGSGGERLTADIGIRDGKIASIGPLRGASATTLINATGKVVTPGFIDLMGQTTLVYVTDRPSAESRLRQGITTHLSGEGWSHAPQNAYTQPEPEEVGDRKYSWERFSEYFEILEAEGLPLNVVHNVGAAQVRRIVLGEKDRAPSEEELERMKRHVRDAMEDGAVGLSTSLIYPPGNYATTEELVALASVVAEYGGIYLTHMRNESHDLLNAIDEAITIGRESGAPVHIYHLKAAGQKNWPLMQQAIDKIEAGREAGLDITADIYPYIRNGIGIRFFVAPWHYADGAESLIDRLDDESLRKQLRAEAEADTDTWENWYQNVGEDWDKVLISRVSDYPDKTVAGKSVAEAARDAGVDEWDLFFELAKANVGVSPESMNEEQKWLALQTPWIMIDTDTAPANPDSIETTHPRAFGAFPRIIAKYVREDKVLPLTDAIRRMTSLPANRLGLSDRGLLQVGMAADVLVFDEEKIQDQATFAEPMKYATGIDYVIVNGIPVIDDQELMRDRMPGSVLRPEFSEMTRGR